MSINLKIKEAKETKNPKLFKEITKYYESKFINNVIKNHGKDYVNEAKDILPYFVEYYFDNDLKTNLSSYLYERAKNFLSIKVNFDNIINSNSKLLIRQYYINKLSYILKRDCYSKLLSNDQKYELSRCIVNDIFNNYVKEKKLSSVPNYFNNMLKKKISLFLNEEKLILKYIQYCGLDNKIKNYFYEKYMYVYHLYDVSIDEYKDAINNILSTKYFFNINIESKLKKCLDKTRINKEKIYHEKEKEFKNGNLEYIDEVKEHYLYILDLVFNKVKDKVNLSQKELKMLLEEKYDSYFITIVERIKDNYIKEDFNFQKYINTVLTYYIMNYKTNQKIFYVDEDLKNKDIDDNLYLVNKYAIKYAGSCSKKILLKKLKDKYKSLIDEYFSRSRKTTFSNFVKKGLRDEAKRINLIYKDDDDLEKAKKPVLK